MKKLIVLILLLALLPACQVSAVSYSIEGWVFIDTNLNGVRETWKGETGVLDNVLITLSNGATKRTSGGWYGFNVQQGNYIVSIAMPGGYDLTSSQSIVVTCTGRMIDRNFGVVVASSEVITPTNVPMLFKGGLVITNDVTLQVAHDMGIENVLLHTTDPNKVAEAYSLSLKPVVSVSDCNLSPMTWQRIGVIARDYPQTVFSFLNEPDLMEQAGASCGATNSPYDANYNLTKAVRQFASLNALSLVFNPDATWIYGNESVAIGTWSSTFRSAYSSMYGNSMGNTMLGTHIYPAWWNGEQVDDYAGWLSRLDRVNGNVVVTEVGAQGSSNPLALMNYLVNMLDSSPKVTRWYWISWGNAELVNDDGSLTELGMALKAHIG